MDLSNTENHHGEKNGGRAIERKTEMDAVGLVMMVDRYKNWRGRKSSIRRREWSREHEEELREMKCLIRGVDRWCGGLSEWDVGRGSVYEER